MVYKRCVSADDSLTYDFLLTTFGLNTLANRRLITDLIIFQQNLHEQIYLKHNNSFSISQTKTLGDPYKITPAFAYNTIRFNSYFLRTSRIYSKLPAQLRNLDVKSFTMLIKSYNLSELIASQDL